MDINFYKNTSDNNVLNKNITLISTHNIKLKDECNIMTPSILIHGDISNNINYAYIEKWGRYYYVRHKKSISFYVFLENHHYFVLKKNPCYTVNTNPLI